MTKVVVVSGLSCSGKSTLLRRLGDDLGAACLALDDYYFATDPDLRESTNFDDPAIFDWALLNRHVQALRSGLAIDTPIYGFNECRAIGARHVPVRDVTVVEGQYCALDETLVSLADLTVMLDVDVETCLARRIERDHTRGRKTEESIARFRTEILPRYLAIEPTLRARSSLILTADTVDDWVRLIAAALGLTI